MIAFSCLFLLVISTVSMVSTVSTLASKHFYSFAHCPYHTRTASIITFYHKTHHPRNLRPTWSMDTNPIGSGVAMMLPLPWGLWVCTGGSGYPGSLFWAHHPIMSNIVGLLSSSTALLPGIFSSCYKRWNLHLKVHITIDNHVQQ